MKDHSCVVCAVLFVIAAAACGGSDSQFGPGPAGGVGPNGRTVGGACIDDRDCASRCTRKDAYPGGMCTVSCRGDLDCPAGTVCVDDDGGICAVSCHAAVDCDAWRAGYRCDNTDRKGADGQALVCRRP